jgi:adenosylhomocysteine nucleosidase
MKKVFIVAVPEEVNHIENIFGYPIIYSGAGKINATMAACKAHELEFEEVINIGSCGSMKLKMGEIVQIGNVFHDIDFSPLCEYGDTLFEPDSFQIQINSDSPYNCFTTDYFYDHSYIQKYSPEYLKMIDKCDVFDMECFALAKVCKKYNMKFSSYKWVSDNGDGGNWEENCKVSFEKIKMLLNEN